MGTPRESLDVLVSEEFLQELDAIAERLHLADRAAVLQHAVVLLHLASRAVEQGAQICLHYPDGASQEVRLRPRFQPRVIDGGKPSQP
jgi:hypothetical protein